MKTHVKAFIQYFVVAIALGLTACAEKPAPVTSLYERLGGKEAIVKVVDEFVTNVGADSRINAFFAKTDIPRMKGHLVDLVCQSTGGPCQYAGRDMKPLHANMGIKDEHFNALVEDLVQALDKFNAPQKEKDELLGLLGPMRKDIVTA
jgi:hemoglobin